MKAKLYGCNIFEIFHMPDLTIPERWQDNPKKNAISFFSVTFLCIPSSYLDFHCCHSLTKDTDQEDEEVAAEDEEDMGVIETYSNYKPSKLKVTCPIALLSYSYSLAWLQTPVSIWF